MGEEVCVPSTLPSCTVTPEPQLSGLCPISSWPWHSCDSGAGPAREGVAGAGCQVFSPAAAGAGLPARLLSSREVLAAEPASPTAQAPGLFHYFIKVHYAGEGTGNKT